MKSQKIQEMSNEALLKQKKTTEVATGALSGLLTVLLIVTISLCFNKGYSTGLPYLVIVFSLSSIVFMNLANVRAIKKELQTRSQVL